METIQNLNLQKLKQIELASFGQAVEEKLEETPAILQQAPVQARAFIDLLGKLNARVKLSQKKSHTQELSVADAKRDRGFSGYKSALAFFRHAEGAEHQAYERLFDHLNLYHFSSKMARVKQTAVMLQFIPDLRNAAGLGKDVKLLNLTPYVDMMEQGNNEVVALEKEVNEEASQMPLGQTQAVVKAFIESYHELIKTVNVLMGLNGETKFAAFRDYVNAVIVEYKRSVLGQKATLEGGTDGDNTPGNGGNDGDEEEPPQG
ncbi:MAG: DUF6261 family protein [Prevotellaceae bacterium]|jgi:hypothetical protein|nr:DUF6261 family protein [Prevotellaceae bacterium]